MSDPEAPTNSHPDTPNATPIGQGRGGPMLSLYQAAEASTVSISTLRRHRSQLEALGAVVTAKGWQIPYAALVALGYVPRSTPPDPVTAPSGTPAGAPVEGQSAALREQVRELEHQLAMARLERDAARDMADERGQTIDTLRIALRALNPAPPAPQTEAPTVAAAGEPSTPPQPTPAPQPGPVPGDPAQPRTGWRRLLGRRQQ